MIRRRTYYALVFLLAACAGEPENDPGHSADVEKLENAGAQEDSASQLPVATSPDAAVANNIRGYAEHILGSAIFKGEGTDSCSMRYTELDMEKGFAKVHAPCGWLYDVNTLKTWSAADGDVVGITTEHQGSYNSYECEFYRFKKGISIVVTDEVLPYGEIRAHLDEMSKKMSERHQFRDEEQLKFNFSKDDDRVEVGLYYVETRIEIPLLSLKWNGEKFEIAKKYNKIPRIDRY